MRTSWLLPVFALLSTSCIVEAPPNGNKTAPPDMERARQVAQNQPPLTVRVLANVEDKVEITGAMLQPGQVTPGEVAKVTIFFRALDEMAADYTVFVHVEDVDGRIERMNLDHRPANGQYPTNQWKKGEIIKDEFALYVPPVPVRGLNLWVGLWEAKTDTRLRLRNPDKVRNDGNDRVLLMQVPVVHP